LPVVDLKAEQERQWSWARRKDFPVESQSGPVSPSCWKLQEPWCWKLQALPGRAHFLAFLVVPHSLALTQSLALNQCFALNQRPARRSHLAAVGRVLRVQQFLR